MKVIVVSGAHSNVGKTHLARALRDLLPGAVRIKIGHHARKPGGDGYYYGMGTGFSAIAAEHADAGYLVIESNTILKEITPDCTIYLSAEDPKPSAEIAVKKADIIRGEPISASTISAIAERLNCDESSMRRIAELAGALIDS